MRPAVFLIGCSDTKRAGPCAARDLYTGDLFVKARAYVERQGAPWFILSALHGLVRPDDVLGAYNLHLRGLSLPQRREWGARVLEGLALAGHGDARLIVLAGKPYRDALGAPPERLAAPLAGLGIGQQLALLKRAVAGECVL